MSLSSEPDDQIFWYHKSTWAVRLRVILGLSVVYLPFSASSHALLVQFSPIYCGKRFFGSTFMCVGYDWVGKMIILKSLGRQPGMTSLIRSTLITRHFRIIVVALLKRLWDWRGFEICPSTQSQRPSRKPFTPTAFIYWSCTKDPLRWLKNLWQCLSTTALAIFTLTPNLGQPALLLFATTSGVVVLPAKCALMIVSVIRMVGYILFYQ
jgi:hypothetical protein